MRSPPDGTACLPSHRTCLLSAGILARVTSPSLVYLQPLLERLNRPAAAASVHGQRAESLWRFNHKAVLVLLGEPADGADDFVDQRPKLHGLGQNSNFPASILERSSTWLMRPSRRVPGSNAMHALKRLLCLFSAEPGCVSDHHFGESNDDVERVRSSWLALDTNCDFMFDCPAQRDS
jgi:hypothetical protein